MSYRRLVVFLCCVAMLAASVEIPFKAGSWSGKLDSKGAVLKELYFKGKRMTSPGNEKKGIDYSFEDMVLGDGGGKVELCEEIQKLEFEPRVVNPAQMSFTACGVGAFPELRFTKTYKFDGKKNEFSVTWEYKNIGSKTVSAGIRTSASSETTKASQIPSIIPKMARSSPRIIQVQP